MFLWVDCDSSSVVLYAMIGLNSTVSSAMVLGYIDHTPKGFGGDYIRFLGWLTLEVG